MKQLIKRILGIKTRFRSGKYWENRYAAGGNSGDGSYGQLAQFKADFINRFIDEHGIQSAIEFGCGDGHQLSLIQYPSYIGLDVSASVVKHCREKFSNDQTKSFQRYQPKESIPKELKADLSLSLDVLYHIIEEDLFRKHVQDLFAVAEKYVIIYSTNFDKAETTHVLHRRFTDYIESDLKNFTLLSVTKNPYPGVGPGRSDADFYVYQRKG